MTEPAEPIVKRIDRLLIETSLQGMRPAGIMLGRDQMDEFITYMFPRGQTAEQARSPKNYCGISVSQQIGVDGVVLVTETLGPFMPLGDDDQGNPVAARVRRRWVGAYPILF